MKATDIIQAKIDFLSGNRDRDLDDTMKAYVEQDQDLAQELEFIEAFFNEASETPVEQPSANLDARFYQMLSQAQTAQAATVQATPKKPGVLTRLFEWLTPRPAMQMAMMAAIFTLGFSAQYINPDDSSVQVVQNSKGMTQLQEQVQSLSALVALSMIKDNAAGTRLTGIRYTRQSDANDPALNAELVRMLNHDSSTAVRLAAADALAERGLDQAIAAQLLEHLPEQKPLMQVSLIKLLLDTKNRQTDIALANMVKDRALADDAIEFYRELKQQTSARKAI